MGVLNDNMVGGASGVTGPYTIANSCRFNDDDSPYLTWTPGSSGTQTKFTISFWYKIASTGSSVTRRTFFSAGTSVHNEFVIGQGSGGTGDDINIQGYISGSANFELTTNRKFRDSTNWYHVVVAVDTSQGTTSNKLKLYINGVEETSFATDGRSSMGSNQIVNSNVPHRVGQFARVGGHYMDGYIAEFHSVENQQLTPASFGETDEDYGHWKPIKYDGSYGTNGFYLDFSNNGTKHVLSAVGDAKHSTAQSKVPSSSSSIYLDGSGDRVEASSASADFAFGTGDFTIEGWLYWTSAGTDKTWIVNRESSSGNAWYIGMDTSYYIAMATGNAVILNSNTAMNAYLNSWVHIAFTRQSGTLRVYIGGVQKNSAASAHDFSLTNKIKLGDGDTQGAGAITGYFDEVRISRSCRYPDGTTFTPSTTPFTDDATTILLIQSNTSNNSTTFVDSSGVTGGLGNDASGEDNHFTPTNIASSDQVTDSPTNNFATLNYLAKATNHTHSEANLKVTGASGANRAMSTIGFDSGKWYYEVLILTYGGTHPSVGVVTTQATNTLNTTYTGSDAGGFGIYSGGINHNSSTNGGTYSSYTTGDIIGVACDMDNLKVYFYKNGSNAITSGTAYETLTANTTYAFATSTNSTGVQVANFGQDGTFAGNKTAQGNTDGKYGNFYYSVPTGFKALCLQNLPEPTVIPSEHFNIHTYTQSGSNNNGDAVTVTTQASNGIVWIKNRSFANAPALFDNVRGGTKLLSPSNYAVEETVGGGITFGTTSYTIGNDSGGYGFNNKVGNNYVAWSWRANGAGSSNSDGTITGTVSANPSAGFSVVSWTGTGSAGTVGHGLSQAPNLIIINNTQYNGSEWLVGSIQSLGSMDFTDILDLASNGAKANGTQFNDTAPTSSVFSVNGISSNNTSQKIIAYCFHSVEGYSKIGQYVGYSDLPFVYTGFSPQYLIQKRIDSSSGANWVLHDTKRDTNGNPIQGTLNIDNNNTEGTYTGTNWDVLSNGFKIRGTDAAQNASSSPYLYIAFADNPFKFSNAR